MCLTAAFVPFVHLSLISHERQRVSELAGFLNCIDYSEQRCLQNLVNLFRLRKGDEHSGTRRLCSGVMEELKLRRTCCPEQQHLEIICSVYEGFMRETSALQHVA